MKMESSMAKSKSVSIYADTEFGKLLECAMRDDGESDTYIKAFFGKANDEERVSVGLPPTGNHKMTTGSSDDKSHRPQIFADLIGQEKAKRQLRYLIDSAKKRGAPLEHVLLVGPKGLGKTSFAGVIANEMGGKFKPILGASMSSSEMESVFDDMTPDNPDILFIDELHRVPQKTQELLYTAMEDFKYYKSTYGVYGTHKSFEVSLPGYTLIGATTEEGKLADPFRERFGMIVRLEFYSEAELTEIICHDAATQTPISMKTALNIAQRSKGVPRVAKTIYRRLRDVLLTTDCTEEEALKTLQTDMGIDELGLTQIDRKYMGAVLSLGNASLATLGSMTGEEPTNIKETVEPFLLRMGFVGITSRGRHLTSKGIKYLLKGQ